jgi:cation diffusion facilitator CzcD-associated flavoprotein CzcO
MPTAEPLSVEVRVAIIGAGFGGLGVALKLHHAGHRNFVVYERAADVGGTWFHNTYPGAACDAPSHIYSYSFAQQVDWSRRFAPGPEIQAYLRRCVDDAGIAARIETGAEVTAARWTGRDWLIELADGRRERADVLVPAVGQLTVPAIPELEGLQSFRGPAFHTGSWCHDVDLTGKRVAVIGTGASAIQVVPAIAAHTAHVTVFQRTAPYVFAKSDATYSDRLHRRYHGAPILKSAVRLIIWSYFELVTAMFTRWPAVLELLGRIHRRVLRAQVPDPALRADLQPGLRIGCKRILISDDYYATLARSDVTLETAPIERVTETGIVTSGGTHTADVIVFGTGFTTTPFVSSVAIFGRDGMALSQAWAERAGAFLGISVPRFPNMFLVYGPNTNLGSGSIIYMLESQADHVVAAVRAIAECAGTVLEVDDGAFRRFLAAMAARQKHTVWQGCRSWYLDHRGQDTHNWPWLMSTYRRRTRRVRARDYTISVLGKEAGVTG